LEIGSGWRDPVAEWCALPLSEKSILGGEVLRGFGVGCGLVDLRRVEASSDIAVASMASLERGGTSVEHLEEGYVEREREVEVVFEACAQGTFFEVPRSRRWR
jgi:hypothetical protein